MHRSTRLFELIQILRAARTPQTAEALAARLEVSTRTIYRDIAALQAMRTPIEGEAGVGYVMRRGYDLPPLNFDEEETEALRVGLSMLARTGDTALQQAAERIRLKINALNQPAGWLQVAAQGAPPDSCDLGCVSIAMLRDAIRTETKLRLTYRDSEQVETDRTVRPVAIIYHLECVMLAAWCELRGGFRHFRSDRMWECNVLSERFTGDGEALRSLWVASNGLEVVAQGSPLDPMRHTSAAPSR